MRSPPLVLVKVAALAPLAVGQRQRPGRRSPACSRAICWRSCWAARRSRFARSCAATSRRSRRWPRATASRCCACSTAWSSSKRHAERSCRRCGACRASQSISLDNIVSARLMIVSQKAMAADQARAAQRRPARHRCGTPAVTGKGIGVAVVDSGIARHIGADRQGRRAVNFATGESDARTTGSATARTSPASSPASTRARPDAALQERHRARRAPGQRARAGPRRRRLHQRRHRRHPVGHRQPRQVRRSASMNLSLGHPISRAVPLDPLCLAAEKRGRERPGRGGLGRQQRQGRRRAHASSAASRLPATRRA